MSSGERLAHHRGHDDSDALFGLGKLLWPEPAQVTVQRTSRQSARSRAQYLPLPSASDPRLLLPARPRRLAAAATRHQPAPSAKARLRRALAALGMASGLGSITMRRQILVNADDPATDTIESFFSRLLDRDVVLSLHIGRRRANRKPVVQVLSSTGKILGFAKVGIDPLTNSLVRAEAAALKLLAGADLKIVTAAQIMFFDSWNSLDILMASPLAVWQRRQPLPADHLVAAAREVAALVPASTLTLREWMDVSGLRERVAEPAEGAAATDLQGAVADLLAGSGEVLLTCGAWHGDWTPWNMAFVDGRLLVWDWERFSAPAPIGFDALHYTLHRALITERRPPRQAVEDLASDAAALLAPYGVAPESAPAVVVAYLAEVSCRYLHDGLEQTGARLGRVSEWLIPVVAALARR